MSADDAKYLIPYGWSPGMVGADVGGRAADRGTSMNQLPWEQSDPNLMSAAQRRRSAKAAVYVDLFAEVHFSAHGTAEHEPPQGIAEHLCRSPEIDIARPAQQSGPPCICEFILCLVVEPEFQKDRLGDYQERFVDLWVPKFGRRVAIAVYVWHVLRQSRLMDWLIRALGWGDLL
jgi:hypothetical protein